MGDPLFAFAAAFFRRRTVSSSGYSGNGSMSAGMIISFRGSDDPSPRFDCGGGIKEEMSARMRVSCSDKSCRMSSTCSELKMSEFDALIIRRVLASTTDIKRQKKRKEKKTQKKKKSTTNNTQNSLYQ